MRVYSFFVASALAASLTVVASRDSLNRNRPHSRWKSSFGEFFTQLEGRSNSEIRFAAFEKHACKAYPAKPGHYCSFTYSTKLPAQQFSILPTRATFSGTFFADETGRLRFEMVIG